MYNAFFGFSETPFSLSPDPAFFYRSEQHEKALANLVYGVQARKGFIVLTGEVGTVKTNLADTQKTLADTRSEFETAMRKVQGETQLLHRTFVWSIGAKGLFGLFEVIGALISYFIDPATIKAFTYWLTRSELQQEPNNAIAQLHALHSQMLHAAGRHANTALQFLNNAPKSGTLTDMIEWQSRWFLSHAHVHQDGVKARGTIENLGAGFARTVIP